MFFKYVTKLLYIKGYTALITAATNGKLEVAAELVVHAFWPYDFSRCDRVLWSFFVVVALFFFLDVDRRKK